MANIFLTNICNLQCPYCFANRYTYETANEITIESFKKALDFAASSHNPNEKLGLIGGEPTLHSKFSEILDILSADDRFAYVNLFTNGLCVDKYLQQLRHPKFYILINCNSEEYMGTSAFNKMCRNIDLLMKCTDFKNKVTLGINIADKDFEYQYIIDLLEKYSMHTLRMAVASPNSEEKRNINVFSYFESIKPRLVSFINDLLSDDIVPCYDCNKLPSCLLSEEEKTHMRAEIDRIRGKAEKSDIPNYLFDGHDFAVYTEPSRCYPAVDILQDLTAVRCFGISDVSRVNISDFASIKELRNYYLGRFDSVVYKKKSNERCGQCELRLAERCMGGCIAYTLKDIL